MNDLMFFNKENSCFNEYRHNRTVIWENFHFWDRSGPVWSHLDRTVHFWSRTDPKKLGLDRALMDRSPTLLQTLFHNPAYSRVSCQQPRSRRWYLIDSITRKHGMWNFLVTRIMIALVIELMHRKRFP